MCIRDSLKIARRGIGRDVEELLPGRLGQRVLELHRVALVRLGDETDYDVPSNPGDAAFENTFRIVRIGPCIILPQIRLAVTVRVLRGVTGIAGIESVGRLPRVWDSVAIGIRRRR